jgi:cell division protein FtsL
MKTLELPYICFGRNKGNVTDFYDIREKSSSIPEEIVIFFRDSITKSIQWESSDETADYVDCFLIWHVNHSVFLFAKLSDGGKDSFNRNHSMQIDAVYLTNEQLPDTNDNKTVFFASLCFSSVWEHWGKRKILQPVDENEQKVTELSKKFREFFSEKNLSVNSLFIAYHQYFTPCGIDQIVYNIPNNKKSPNQKSIPVETQPQPIKFPTPPQEKQFTYTSPQRQHINVVLIILLILSFIAVIVWTHKKHEEEITKLTSEKNILASKNNELTSEKNRLISENNELTSEKNRLTSKNNDLKKELQNAYINADKTLQSENKSLKNQNQKLNDKINSMRENIKIIYGHINDI